MFDAKVLVVLHLEVVIFSCNLKQTCGKTDLYIGIASA